ncbi:MAG: trigger factor [Chloroflexi bacterium]|nr:trigger factor [Chloroflexota bacterium]
MKVQKEFTDDQQVKITAEFEPELFEQYMHKAARKISQRTRIPGFRPGKAPYAMVLSHIGEASIKEEALELLLDKVYPEVLEEAQIKPYGPGNLDEIKSENPPIFLFTIPLEPEVDLGDVDSLRESYVLPDVSEQEVDDFILRARQNASTIVPLETPAAEGNLLYLTLEALNLEPAEGENPDLIKAVPQQVLIPTETEQRESEWPFQGFARSLIGYNAGENAVITHEFPEDASDEELRGKNVRFTVNIQSVKAMQLPEIDEDFLTEMGNFKSVEDLRTAVLERLKAETTAEYEDKYYLGLVDRVRQEAKIKYPPQMLKEEEEQVLHRFEHELSHRQLDLNVYLKMRKIERDEFIKQEVTPTAINRLERSLVMEALSKKFDIKISNETLEKQISTIVNELIMSGELQEVQKELGEKKFANAISMEAANRALESAIRMQLRTIASPESIPAIQSETESSLEPVAQADQEEQTAS